jgi:hypothetical protein
MPLTESMMALASLAGRTVIAAAVTDGWVAVKHKIAGLLGRDDADRAKLMEQRLDLTRQQLVDVTGAELARARTVLESQWVTRLADLLEEHPDAAIGLQALVTEVQAALPSTMMAVDHSVAANRDVNVTAASGGIAAAVIDGHVEPPSPTGPGPRSR